LRSAMATGQVTGEHFRGLWADVGTPERLKQVDAMVRTQANDALSA